MPQKVVDYSKTVVYKIVCHDLNVKDLYVGSTSNFRKRKYHHKSNCKNEKEIYKIKIYETIREHGGWDNWNMLEVEKFPCKDGNEARTRERYWFEQLEAGLNSRIPITHAKEYRLEHKEQKKEYDKKYRSDNAEKIKLIHANWNSENAEKKKQYSEKYRAKNREEINKRKREWRAKKKLEHAQ